MRAGTLHGTRAPNGGALKFLGCNAAPPLPLHAGAPGALDRHPARRPPRRARLRRNAAWRLPPQPPRRLPPGLPRLPGLRLRAGPCADAFVPSRSLRRVIARNTGVTLNVLPALARPDHYALFRRYLAARHPDGTMAAMGREGYGVAGRGERGRDPPRRVPQPRRAALRRLRVRCCRRRALCGLFLLRAHAGQGQPGQLHDSQPRGRGPRKQALPYVYLGYWIDGCDKMDYKARFRPLEVHGTGGWTTLDDPANGQDVSNH